jgi:hypothetical protein
MIREPVKVLLDRMDSHPQEFVIIDPVNEPWMPIGRSKWSDFIEKYEKYFTDEETSAVKNKFGEIQMNNMKQDFTKVLLAPVEEQESEKLDARGLLKALGKGKKHRMQASMDSPPTKMHIPINQIELMKQALDEARKEKETKIKMSTKGRYESISSR